MKFSQFLKETLIEKARDIKDLFASFSDGVFTKDGSDLRSGTINLQAYFKMEHLAKCKSLKGLPEILDGDLIISAIQLDSLMDGPVSVTGYYSCDSNNLTSLVGAAKRIGTGKSGGFFTCERNKLTSLKDVHKVFEYIDGEFYAMDNPIESHVLGVLKIEGLQRCQIDNTEVSTILNKYLPNTRGNDAVIECQNELLDAGFEEYAQL